MTKKEALFTPSTIQKKVCLLFGILSIVFSCVENQSEHINQAKSESKEVIRILKTIDTTKSILGKLELAHIAMRLANSSENDSLESECLFKVGKLNLLQRNFDSSYYYLTKARTAFHKLNNSNGIIKVNGALINYNCLRDQHEKVTQLIIDTDDFIAKEREPSEAYIYYYYQKVRFYYQLGLQDSTLAIAHYADSLSKSINSTKYQPQLKSVKGVVYANLGKDTLAIQSYKNVLNEYKPFEKNKATILINLGNTYGRIGHLDSSLYYFSKALHLYEQTKASKSLISKLKMDMAYILGDLDPTISRSYYDQVDSALLNVRDQFYYLYVKSTFLSAKKDKINALLEALEFTKSQEFPALQFEEMCHFELYTHYSDLGDYQAALLSFEQYSEISKKIKADETFFNLEKLELIHNVKEKEQKIRNQKTLIIEKNRFISAQKIKIYLFATMVLLVLVVLFLLRKNYKKRIKITALNLQQTELSQKLLIKEMDPISLQLGSATETIQIVKNKLSKIEDGNEKNDINQAKLALNEWLINFQEKNSTVAAHKIIESDFLIKLDKFQDLTNSEKKVIILIRQGYKSKEISDRLNLAVNTVEIYRSRIRTKLNIAQNDQLQETINKM